MTLVKQPRKISLVEFFKDIVEISYIGDIRTYVKAENKEKTLNIVKGSFDKYVELYKKFLNETNPNFEIDHFEHELSPIDYIYKINPNLLNSIINYNRDYFISQGISNPLLYFCNNLSPNERRFLIDNYLKSLNFKYSILQLITAVVSTSPNKIVLLF